MQGFIDLHGVFVFHPACRRGAIAPPGLRGGQYVLEWGGPKAQGAADGEFGPLLVEIPKKHGTGSARFYERGAVIGDKRVGCDNLKDVVFVPGDGEKGFAPKQKI